MTTLCPSPEVDKGVQLLNHLRTYKRVAPPGDYEKNYKPATEEEQVVEVMINMIKEFSIYTNNRKKKIILISGD